MRGGLPRVWALLDERPGNVSQVLGVVEALGFRFEAKEIVYTPLARLPNFVRGASLVGIAAASRAGLAPPWPDVVVGAGRRMAPVARWIKRQSGGRAFLVQIMRPGPRLGGFDLLAIPRHDGLAAGGPVLVMTGAPHRVTPERLAAAAVEWAPAFAHLAEPRFAVVLGGSTRLARFTPAMAAAFGRLASGMARAHGGALLVTTSRRTEPGLAEALAAAIDVPAFVFRWDAEGAARAPNPYFGILALAKAVLVSGDSVSMCSEACGTGKPVFVFAPREAMAPRQRRFLVELCDLGFARPLAEAAVARPFDGWSGARLNAAGDIAAAIRARLEAGR